MPHLDIFQSMWAMETFAGKEHTARDSVEKIVTAGFSGVDVLAIPEAAPFTGYWLDALKETDLSLTMTAIPNTTDRPLTETLELADRWRDRLRHITVIPQVLPQNVHYCIDLLSDWYAQAREAEIPIYIETHRNSMAECPQLTLKLLEAIPEMMINADLSHYVVAQEFDAPQMQAEQHQQMDRIIARSEAFQGRIASPEQVQIQLDFPQHQVWVEAFKNWWQTGFYSWHSRHAYNDEARLVFLCELGPPPYAITDANGQELSDRWQEALTLKRWAEQIWAELDKQR